MTSSALPQSKAPPLGWSSHFKRRITNALAISIVRFLVALPHPGLVALRQTFVRRSQNCVGAAGARCTAGFQSRQCPLWVIRVGPVQPTASPDVRFTSDSVRVRQRRKLTLSARSRHMQRSKQCLYSITSSARASNVGGISRPSAFAVLRLMVSSYFVGACTGRSAGFSPLRMRST
jgi:hypothetical protein